VNEQETVDRIALLAGPRLAKLLRLSTATHIYEPVAGALNSVAVESGVRVVFNKSLRELQPYKDLQRFTGDERIMQSIVDPGLLPIAKAISRDVLGQRILVTRRIAPKENDKGAVAHIDGYGIRILLYRDADSAETIVAWECLYGVA
jgi:hypothetical protein